MLSRLVFLALASPTLRVAGGPGEAAGRLNAARRRPARDAAYFSLAYGGVKDDPVAVRRQWNSTEGVGYEDLENADAAAFGNAVATRFNGTVKK